MARKERQKPELTRRLMSAEPRLTSVLLPAVFLTNTGTEERSGKRASVKHLGKYIVISLSGSRHALRWPLDFLLLLFASLYPVELSNFV